MIVLPPSDESESYFIEVANSSWDNFIKDKTEIYQDVMTKSKTLVLKYLLKTRDNKEHTFYLHYRYSSDLLYCFVEEPGVQ
jgi:hypothetical protein